MSNLILKTVLQILKVILVPLKGIKYCKSSCCECECMKNTNIEESIKDNDDIKEK